VITPLPIADAFGHQCGFEDKQLFKKQMTALYEKTVIEHNPA